MKLYKMGLYSVCLHDTVRMSGRSAFPDRECQRDLGTTGYLMLTGHLDSTRQVGRGRPGRGKSRVPSPHQSKSARNEPRPSHPARQTQRQRNFVVPELQDTAHELRPTPELLSLGCSSTVLTGPTLRLPGTIKMLCASPVSRHSSDLSNSRLGARSTAAPISP
jgi:hypothetical protein